MLATSGQFKLLNSNVCSAASALSDAGLILLATSIHTIKPDWLPIGAEPMADKQRGSGLTCSVLFTADDPGGYPLFLTKHWFPPTNAGVLRTHLRWLILDLFIAQAQNPELPAVNEANLEREDIKATALQ